MGKTGWVSLAVATLLMATLICVPLSIRVTLNTSAAEQESDGTLSLLPEESLPLNLSEGSTATNAPVADDPLAGSAPAATKQLPITTSPTPATTPASNLDTRQQELSLRGTTETVDKPSPVAASASKPATTVKQTAKQSPTKPAEVKPAATKAETKAAPKSNTKPAPEPATTPAATPAGALLEQMDLPTETNPTAAKPAAAPSLRELFTEEEIDNPELDSAIVAAVGAPGLTPDDVPPIAMEGERNFVGVISTGSDQAVGLEEGEITLGQVLRGEGGDQGKQAVGSSLSGYNPIRSGAMVLLLLALLFAGAWLARKVRRPFGGLNQATLAVIETVSIGPGRQLIIVEMNNDALVLGVTPHSINMLDKVPLGELNGSYQRTVNTIIKREERSMPEDWQERPAFTTPASVRPAPALASAATYGPSGRLTVSQLRQAGSLGQPARALAGAGSFATPHLAQERNTKAELIDRIRQQLNNLER